MATQKKVHSEFSARLNVTFKAGFGDDNHDQLMRELVAFLKLKRAVGSSNSWIKEAILQAFMRERSGVADNATFAQLSDVKHVVGAQHVGTAPQGEKAPPAADASVLASKPLPEPPAMVANEEREGTRAEGPDQAGGGLADADYADLLDNPASDARQQNDLPGPAVLPRGLLSVMG
jgi:hypothetical protein